MKRKNRTRDDDPHMVPWPVNDENDVVAVDTTWGKLQPLEVASDVRTVGELELIRLVAEGAVLVDCRSEGTTGGCTIPGSLNIPYDGVTERRDDLDAERLSILFCNGPQCPQSPTAIEALVEAGYPASALAYYRGGMHDWVTLSMPTEPTDN
jgi:rhodanese-related sulfurtransferase